MRRIGAFLVPESKLKPPGMAAVTYDILRRGRRIEQRACVHTSFRRLARA